MLRVARSVVYNLRAGGPRQLAVRALGRAGRVFSRSYDAIVYRLDDLDVPEPVPGEGAELRELDWPGLLDGEYFKAVHFPDLIRRRFDDGERCVGVFFEGRLGHVSWMTRGRLQIDRGIPVVPVVGGVGIYDMFTLPDFRGRGAQTHALQALCRMARGDGADRAVALVREGNAPSRHVFRKCGFAEIGDLRYRRRLWIERLDHPPL